MKRGDRLKVYVAVRRFGTKNSVAIWKGIVFFALFLASAFSASVFVISATQMAASKSITNGARIILEDSATAACFSTMPYKDKLPLQFKLDGDEEYLYCPWGRRSTGARMLVSGLALFIPSLVFFFGVYKHKREVVCLGAIVSTFVGITFFILMCFDASAIKKSQEWCDSGLAGARWATTPRPTVQCNYVPYILTTLLGAGSSLIWIICVFLLAYYARRRMTLPRQQPEQRVSRILQLGEDGFPSETLRDL